ncbi:M1 family metallopeptidase [Streptomyces sp. NPDC059876]|uniref:M1 family metallopeptidase n=2 Tax=Streptomyces TaxID=1883 RepID=UPI0036588B4B
MDLSRRAFTMAAALVLAGPAISATAKENGGSADDGFNVRHYAVDLSYRPDSDTLAGATTILGRATRRLPQFDLHFMLTVSSVVVNNEPATFSTGNGRLTITPKRPIEHGGELLVEVRYSDTPDTYPGGEEHGAGWKRTANGALAVFSSAWWYPTAFDVADKATRDLRVVVPTGLQVVANGTLRSGGPVPVPGGDQWTWRNEVPQPNLTALLAIGRYDLKISTVLGGKQLVTAYGTDLGPLDAPARASVERTPEIVAALSKWFGPYPFAALGGLVDTDYRTPVATATRPIYPGGFFEDGVNTSLVAHEMAHQWYGNGVYPTPNEQWLSEGFATYAEFLWSEREGQGTAAELAQSNYDLYPADHKAWKQAPVNPDPDNVLSFPIYERGALALQALRTRVGDDTFFRILRTWFAEQKTDEAATTAGFTAHAERVAGSGLDDVFRPWIYGTERPAVGPNGRLGKAKTMTKPKSFDTIDNNSTRFAAARH